MGALIAKVPTTLCITCSTHLHHAAPTSHLTPAAPPPTGDAYRVWTGRAAESFTFQDVGAGLLSDEGRSYHLVVCSYAMHVLEPSFLFPTLQQLALVAAHLLILAPHKLPRVRTEHSFPASFPCLVLKRFKCADTT